MKTSLLIILGLTILAVAWAGKSKKNARDVEKPEPVDQEKKESSNNANEAADADKESKSAKEKDDDDSSKSKKNKAKGKSSDESNTDGKSKKNSESASGANKSSKKTPKDKTEENNDISEDLDDILNEDDEEEEVEIPSVDDLDTESDPIELGEQIKNLTDKKQRRALVAELKKAWQKNDGTLPGRFYQAAYASLSNKKGAKQKAEEFWNKHLEKATQSVMNPTKSIFGKANSGVGNALENAKKIAQADPVGIALRNGESVLLTALSNSLKNFGKLTDMLYDGTKNTSKLIRAATFPVDFVPILSDIKNNVHDFVEEQADRGKFLTGSFAENGSTAFDMAAKNAKKKADEKQDLLTRQFSSTRRI